MSRVNKCVELLAARQPIYYASAEHRTYDGGREKSPAAICRKIALAEDGAAIEVWGDGNQTRSYCFVDDCVEDSTVIVRRL